MERAAGGPATTRPAKRGITASEYDTFAPKRTVSRKAHTPGKADEDPMPASSGAQPAAKFSSSPAPSQGIIDARQELRRCEYVALGPGPGRRCQ